MRHCQLLHNRFWDPQPTQPLTIIRHLVLLTKMHKYWAVCFLKQQDTLCLWFRLSMLPQRTVGLVFSWRKISIFSSSPFLLGTLAQIYPLFAWFLDWFHSLSTLFSLPTVQIPDEFVATIFLQLPTILLLAGTVAVDIIALETIGCTRWKRR